ncbi:MAG: hypothetical protein ACF8LL_02495, partial [Phycisphaerales bacterium]
MSRVILILVRTGLTFLGLAMVGVGIASLALSDKPHFRDPETPDTVLLTMRIGSIGYGILLATPPRWLARAPYIAGLLVVFTAAFSVGLFQKLHRPTSPLLPALLDVFLRVIPAALALCLVA